MLAHPRPRSVAVVGLGAGITLGAVLAHPELEAVTVIEIEPEVVAAARLFSHVNAAALDDPRLEITFQDGRNHLLTTRERYDVITADPIHPWVRGAAYLYTLEYYDLAAQRLTPGGIMCQWLPLYELSLENVRAAAASFDRAFEYTTLWQTANDAILVGSNNPIGFDFEELGQRLASPPVDRQLAQIGLADAGSFLAELALDDRAMEAFTEGSFLNTDDNLYLEFASPKQVSSSEITTITRATRRRTRHSVER